MKYFKIFFLLSILFLIIYLYKNNFIFLPNIISFNKLFISILFLFAGFIVDVLAWFKTFNSYVSYSNFRKAIISQGLSIFGKYIPGKMWVIAGRSEYIAQIYNISRIQTNSLSLNSQIISLWSSLIIGSIGLLAIGDFVEYSIPIIILFLLLSLLMFSTYFHNLFEITLTKFFKKKICLPQLTFKNTLRIAKWYLITWLCWGVSFYFLSTALTDMNLSLSIISCFPLAGSLGMLALIAPGGIGVREGIITGYLVKTGINIQLATTISLASRLWFLLGEVFIFLLASLLTYINKTNLFNSK